MKNGLDIHKIWDIISDKTDFIQGNDRVTDVYLTGKKDIDKYLKMIDKEFPLETTNFYASW